MRIAFVATGGFDETGRERVIPSLLWLVERLAREHDVVVYVLRHEERPRRYALLGATIHDLGRPRGLVRQFFSLAAALRAEPAFDIIHGYWGSPAGLLASLLGRVLRTRSVVTCDSGEFVRLPHIGYGQQASPRGRLAVRAATTLASCVTVCTTYQATLAAAHGVRADIIPLGVDTTLFCRREVEPAAPPFRLLHVASLNPVKDQTTLIQATHRLIERGLPVTLDIVGEDTTAGAVRQTVSALGLSDCVTFHGFRTSGELVALLHSAHAFVLSSLHEAAGVVLLEAASCGVPIVGSAVGYLADWAPDRAIAVPPGDAPALADAVAGLLRDPAQQAVRVRDAGTWARAHDADWTARAFTALYHRLAGSRR